MTEGYFAFDRSILLEPAFLKNPKLGWFLAYCHGHATWQDYDAPTKLGVLPLKRGQFYKDFRTIAQVFGVAKSTVQRWAAKLQKMGHISLKRGPHFMVITVHNYGTISDDVLNRGPQVVKKRAAETPKSGPIRRIKKEKKLKKGDERFFLERERPNPRPSASPPPSSKPPIPAVTAKQVGNPKPIGNIYDPAKYPMLTGESVSEWYARCEKETKCVLLRPGDTERDLGRRAREFVHRQGWL